MTFRTSIVAVALLTLCGAAGAQEDAADLVVRIDRLQAQIRQLTGTVEQLQFRNRQLEEQLRASQTSSPAMAPSPQAQTTVVPPPQTGPLVTRQPMLPSPQQQAAGPSPVTPIAPGRGRGDAFDPNATPNAPGAPRALGGGTLAATSPIVTPEPTDTAPIGAPGGREAGAPLDLTSMSSNQPPLDPTRTPMSQPTAPPRNSNANPNAVAAVAPPSNTPKDEYDLGYGYILRKDYALAEDTFRAFLRKHPNDKLTPEAQYWLGESYYQRQRYQDAADNFLIVVRNHDQSGKAPDSLLRLGQSLTAIGQKEMACASLAEVGRKYPRASAGVKRGVEQEQKRAKC